MLDQLIAMAIHLDSLLRARHYPSRGFGFLPQKENQVRKQEEEERSCTFPGRHGCALLLPVHPVHPPSCNLPGLSWPPTESCPSGRRFCRQFPRLVSGLIFTHSSNPFTTTITVHALDNHSLETGLVCQTTILISLTVAHIHMHNPRISWTERSLLGWSHECQGRCHSVFICVTSVKSPDEATHIPIPEEYRDLQVAFSKTRACPLFAHRTALSTYCLVLPSRGDTSTLSRMQRPKPWRSTSRRRWPKASFS
jgi:hypothetical protein